MLTPRRAEGREFEPRPGHYSRMRFSSDQVTGTVFPHLNIPFLPNSKFIENIVLVGKQKLQSISTFLYWYYRGLDKKLPFRPIYCDVTGGSLTCNYWQLEYCNSLLSNNTKQDLSKLQYEQNCFSCLVNKACRFSSSPM